MRSKMEVNSYAVTKSLMAAEIPATTAVMRRTYARC